MLHIRRVSHQAWECAEEYQEAATEPFTLMRRRREDQMQDKECDFFPTARQVFANLTLEEYFDPQQSGHRNARHMFKNFMDPNGVMRELYFLLVYTNAIGEGDHPAFQRGRWAGCRLELMAVTTARFCHYTDISAEVISQLEQAA